jgi:hypothetical protein
MRHHSRADDRKREQEAAQKTALGSVFHERVRDMPNADARAIRLSVIWIITNASKHIFALSRKSRSLLARLLYPVGVGLSRHVLLLLVACRSAESMLETSSR